MNIEAYPDPAPPIIEIIAQYPGQSPEEVERYVTIPIEIAVASTPGLKYIRSNTVYALGFIRLQFEYGRDYYFVRQQAFNRLKDAALPAGRAAGDFAGGQDQRDHPLPARRPAEHGSDQLKTLQDWVVERSLRYRAGRCRCARAWRQDQGVSGRDRPQSDDGLRPHVAADHQRHLGQQLQCRRPDHRDRRAVGQCSRPRRSHVARRYRQHRPDPAGRRAGAAVRCGQGPDRLPAAARHRRA